MVVVKNVSPDGENRRTPETLVQRTEDVSTVTLSPKKPGFHFSFRKKVRVLECKTETKVTECGALKSDHLRHRLCPMCSTEFLRPGEV